MSSKIKKQAIAILASLIICVSFIMGLLHNFGSINAYAAGLNYGNFVYVSDIPYESGSFAAWPAKGIRYDKNANDTAIQLNIAGTWKTFEKGVFASANSAVIYDIKNYNYKYFTAYVGIEKGNIKNGNGAKFFVYTSADGTNWQLRTSETPSVKTPGGKAEYLSADISGAKYLKLVADNNGAELGDQTVWADAKLTNAADGNEMLAYYDAQIKAKDGAAIENDPELEKLVLQRELVRKAGQSVLKKFTQDSGAKNEANEEVLEWLLNDLDALREFMLGGDPMMGNWYNSLTVLSDLYRNYKTDLEDKRLLIKPWYTEAIEGCSTTPSAPWFPAERTYGQLYRTMMFSIALTHDGVVGSWMQKSNEHNQSNALRRYAIYRYMVETDRFVATRWADGTPKYDTTPWFTSLKVEEMRWIMFNIIDDESILWLNDYVQTRINAEPNLASNYHTPHKYIAYKDPNYNNPVYYAEENIEYFNTLFAVDDRGEFGPDSDGEPIQVGDKTRIGLWDAKYVVRGGEDEPEYTLQIYRGTLDYKLQKVWMNFRNQFGTGSVCGGISKSGCNIRGVRGIPATVIGQPGHAAILAYSKDSSGRGNWSIDNNVGGWTVATKGERHMLGWGNASWQRTNATVVYFHLAQAAVNDYDNLVKAEENVMLAKVYQGNTQKQIALYEKALTAQPINIDAWYGLIQAYNEAEKSQQDYCDLARRIANNMYGYPLPMKNLLTLIRAKLTGVEFIYQYDMVYSTFMKKATVLTDSNIGLNTGATQAEAKFLLGLTSNEPTADFSFDGENAGYIVFSSLFDGMGMRFKYSIDGKNSWVEGCSFMAEEPHKLKLTEEQLNALTPENDIYIHIEGAPDTEENYFKIDITAGATPNNLYINDWENKIFGIDSRYEWRIGDGAWTSYKDSSPNLSGNTTVQVRVAGTGKAVPSAPVTFTFTQNNTDKRKYVNVSHLSIEECNTQSRDSSRPYYAPLAIDGNPKTYWHTDIGENLTTLNKKAYIIIKLDRPRYISGLEFQNFQTSTKYYTTVKGAKVYVGNDLENLTEVGSATYPTKNYTLKTVPIEAPEGNENVLYAQYVKLELEVSNRDVFIATCLVNIYEDITKDNLADRIGDSIDIAYSTTQPTNGKVMARLLNEDDYPIEILNNGGRYDYIFNDNGEFTFEYKITGQDNVYSLTAKVDWIDKQKPTFDVSLQYNAAFGAEDSLTAILINLSESVYVLDQNNQITEYVAVENGTVKNVVYYNSAGVTTKIVYFNDKLQATSIDYCENGKVIYTTKFDKDGNIEERKYFDSEGVEAAPPTTDAEKAKYEAFEQSARTNPIEVTFTDDGSFTFKVQDRAGNVSKVEVKVENIDEAAYSVDDDEIIIPTVSVKFDSMVNGKVFGKLIGTGEGMVIENNGGNGEYTFTKDGEFTFGYNFGDQNSSSVKIVVGGLEESPAGNSGNSTALIVSLLVVGVVAVGAAAVAAVIVVKRRKKASVVEE